ncbi:hypothetical protein AA313_de0207773 [Arthrobotrys entomopaga]|nr:hypothetical protein AA313_de0207773 [Arthrobotrys entomopaga]
MTTVRMHDDPKSQPLRFVSRNCAKQAESPFDFLGSLLLSTRCSLGCSSIFEKGTLTHMYMCSTNRFPYMQRPNQPCALLILRIDAKASDKLTHKNLQSYK